MCESKCPCGERRSEYSELGDRPTCVRGGVYVWKSVRRPSADVGSDAFEKRRGRIGALWGLLTSCAGHMRRSSGEDCSWSPSPGTGTARASPARAPRGGRRRANAGAAVVGRRLATGSVPLGGVGSAASAQGVAVPRRSMRSSVHARYCTWHESVPAGVWTPSSAHVLWSPRFSDGALLTSISTATGASSLPSAALRQSAWAGSARASA